MNRDVDLLDEVGPLLASNLGMTLGANFFIGELPVTAIDGMYIVELPGPAPNMYLDTETRLVDVWSRSNSSQTARANLRRVYDILERKGNYSLTNWYIYFSYAGGTISDEDRDAEGGKLFKQTYTFICRNLNNIS